MLERVLFLFLVAFSALKLQSLSSSSSFDTYQLSICQVNFPVEQLSIAYKLFRVSIVGFLHALASYTPVARPF